MGFVTHPVEHALADVIKFSSNPFHILPSGIGNTIQSLAPLALAAVGQPELAAAASAGNSFSKGGSLGQGLLSAGLTYGGAALGGGNTEFGDIGDATGLSDLYDGSDLQDGINGIKGVGSDISSAFKGAYGDASNALNSATGGIVGSPSGGLVSSGTAGNALASSGDLGGGVGGAGSAYGSVGNIDPSLTAGLDSTSSGSYSDPSQLPTQLGSASTGSSDALSSPAIGSNAGSFLNTNSGGSPATPSFANTVGSPSSSSNSIFGNLMGNNLSGLGNILTGGIGVGENAAGANAITKAQKANTAALAPYQNFSFNPSDLTSTPGYQFQLQQGNQELDRQNAAAGNYFSGAALQGGQNFAQGLAGTTYNNAFNQALQTNQAGLGAAEAQAGINNTSAQAKANQAQGNYSVLGNALGGLTGSQAPGQSGIASLLKLLTGSQYQQGS